MYCVTEQATLEEGFMQLIHSSQSITVEVYKLNHQSVLLKILHNCQEVEFIYRIFCSDAHIQIWFNNHS